MANRGPHNLATPPRPASRPTRLSPCPRQFISTVGMGTGTTLPVLSPVNHPGAHPPAPAAGLGQVTSELPRDSLASNTANTTRFHPLDEPVGAQNISLTTLQKVQPLAPAFGLRQLA